MDTYAENDHPEPTREEIDQAKGPLLLEFGTEW
jgi:hypothetical protein